MSIFGSILSKIFHGSEAQAAPAPGGSPAQSTTSQPSAAAPTSSPATSAPTSTAPTASPQASGGAASGPGAGKSVDVAAVLDGLAAKAGQKLDWKHSIVDLMKLLDLDSSLSARKELAQELHYTGNTDDSASMNIWLHKQVMQKLADNGGVVPEDLKH